MKEHPMHKRQFVVKPLVLAIAALSTVGGQAVLAEEKQYAMEEVIVSATRRNESVQDVPSVLMSWVKANWRIMASAI